MRFFRSFSRTRARVRSFAIIWIYFAFSKPPSTHLSLNVHTALPGNYCQPTEILEKDNAKRLHKQNHSSRWFILSRFFLLLFVAPVRSVFGPDRRLSKSFFTPPKLRLNERIEWKMDAQKEWRKKMETKEMKKRKKNCQCVTKSSFAQKDVRVCECLPVQCAQSHSVRVQSSWRNSAKSVK